MNTHRIYANVLVGNDCEFEDFVNIGVPPRKHKEGELQTKIGNWAKIKSHAVIYAGNVIGDNFVAGHGIYMSSNNQIGKNVTIGSLCIVCNDILIEDEVTFGSQTGISEFSVIERGVQFGSHVCTASVLHPLCPKIEECNKGPHVYSGVTVGSGTSIAPDLRIGEGAYIEPGSVVMRDVKPYAVVAGNPAKQIGDVFTLYPGILERVKRYLELSQDTVAQSIKSFEEETSLFPAR